MNNNFYSLTNKKIYIIIILINLKFKIITDLFGVGFNMKCFLNILFNELNLILEIVCLCIFISNMLKKHVSIAFHKLLLTFVVLQSYLAIEYLFNPYISIICTIPALMLIIYIIYRKKFFETVYLYIISYSMLVIIGTFIMIPFRFLLINQSDTHTMILGNVFSLILSKVICSFVELEPIYSFSLKKDYLFRTIIINIFIALFVIISISKIKLKLTVEYYPLITFYVIITVLFNILILKSKHKIDIQEQIIEQYNEYLPVIDELIYQVRSRQHQYNNNLNALNSLALTCNDYDTLKSEIIKNISLMSLENSPSFLLELNLKLLAGFMYTEHAKATKKQLHVSYKIMNYNIITVVPEYVLVELLGILIDNAIENSYCDDDIYIQINCVDNKLYFSISNPGPTVTTEIFRNFFKGGYTTKNTNVSSHGFGLNNLKNIIDKYNGKILLENETINNRIYIKFSIEV